MNNETDNFEQFKSRRRSDLRAQDFQDSNRIGDKWVYWTVIIGVLIALHYAL